MIQNYGTEQMKAQLRALSTRLRWLGLCVAVVAVVFSWANPVLAQSDAYSVEVAVANRSPSEQQAAYLAAIRRVLLNNSGDKTLLNRDKIREGLNNAEQYVTGFTYRTPLPGTVISTDIPITQEVRDTGEATQLMMVTFDRSLIRELIVSSSETNQEEPAPVPVARQSNSALVWLLIQDTGRDILISDPEAINVQARARELAGALGVSLVFPVGDEADRNAVSVNDLLQMNVENVRLGSDRYEQRTILLGGLRRDDNRGSRGWIGQWIKLEGDQQSQADFNSSTLDEALQEGMSVLVDESVTDSAYRYGGPATADTEGLVWIDSVRSLGDYASVIEFLEAVPNVGTVYPKEVGDTTMVFAILPRSALRDIEIATESQNWIRRTAPTLGASTGLGASADLALELNR